ncbi:3-oxosteroid 1-dehydrogenase [Nocardioides sp.]|uniref:3-oxosteroid 1-dehydrogenase n=1 Tax=Nocardioides sp. TaxID=35761 RepID=UPI0035115229
MTGASTDTLPIEVDVVVVGAGGAGMSAALAAAHHGLETVLLEKSPYFGGSTARSGGGVWVPGNYALAAARQIDDGDEAASRLYLDSIVGDLVPKERRDTYLARGPEVLEFLREKTPLRFVWVPDYADYLPEQPGGRAKGRTVEPVPLDARFLGAELERLHPPYTKAPANLIVTQADFRKISLGLRTLKGPLTMARVLVKRLIAMALGRKMVAMGNAIAVSLRQGLRDAGVPVHYETPLTDLLVEDGRVTGVVVERDGARHEVRARRGVILGSGGFEHNAELREKFLPLPTSTEWSTAAPSNTGAGLLAGTAAGAATDLLDEAWWGPTIPLPGRSWFCLAERNLPGSIIVNSAGRRFMNEALPYIEATHEIYKGEATGVSHVPAWMVFDQTYRNRYLFAGVAGRQPFPGRWYKEGVVMRADTLAGLAEKIGVPAEALAGTVERFNGFAATGVDEDFHRGESAYDKYYSDPTVTPNCSLAPIAKGPFYGVKIVPGDLGTKGGLVTDPRARVLREDGTVIPGLYAAGNVSSAVMGRTYPGPGGTIGPALVFGYLAAEDLAQAAAGTPATTDASGAA